MDDDRHVRTIVALRLRGAGYLVFESADGGGALARVQEGGIDMIILDALMPGMDGFEVLKRLHALERRPCVIFLTAMDENDSRVRGYGDTIDFIGKPFEAEDFLVRVAEALRKHQVVLQVARAPGEMPPATAPERNVPQHLVHGMLVDMKSACVAMAVAMRADDREALVSLGHTIKGTSGVFGFRALSDMGGRIEVAARGRDTDLTQGLIDTLALLIEDEIAGQAGSPSPLASRADQSRVMPHIGRAPRDPTLLP